LSSLTPASSIKEESGDEADDDDDRGSDTPTPVNNSPPRSPPVLEREGDLVQEGVSQAAYNRKPPSQWTVSLSLFVLKVEIKFSYSEMYQNLNKIHSKSV